MVDLNIRAEEGPMCSTPWPHLIVRAGFAPRKSFSVSQVELWRSCPTAWGFRYLLGVKTPEHDSSAALETLSGRERSLVFGKLLHAKLEAYFKGQTVDWTDEIGQRALPGLAYLPQGGPVRVEQPIALYMSEIIGGVDVAFQGFVDLEGVVDGALTLIDYKTTGDFKWLKSPETLRQDLQANVYALNMMQRTSGEHQRCRWVYFASKGRPEARKVDFDIKRDTAREIVRQAVVEASVLKGEIDQFREALQRAAYQPQDAGERARFALPLIDHLPKRVGHCPAYGGCPYHHSRGGACQAELTSTEQPRFDLASIHEPKPTAAPAAERQDMPTLLEQLRSNVQANQTAQQAPATPVPSPFAAAPAPAAAPPAAPVFAPAPVFQPPASPAAAPVPPVFGEPPVAPPSPFAVGVAPPPSVPVGAPVPPLFAGVNPPESAPAWAGTPPAPQPSLPAPTPPQAPVAAPPVQEKPKRGRPPRATPGVATAPLAESELARALAGAPTVSEVACVELRYQDGRAYLFPAQALEDLLTALGAK